PPQREGGGGAKHRRGHGRASPCGAPSTASRSPPPRVPRGGGKTVRGSFRWILLIKRATRFVISDCCARRFAKAAGFVFAGVHVRGTSRIRRTEQSWVAPVRSSAAIRR